ADHTWRSVRYVGPGRAGRYGDPPSPVVLAGAWRGPPPPAVPFEVIGRTGGDRAPLDPATDQGRLTLAAYVWADQADRMERLRGPLALAAPVPPAPPPGLASPNPHTTPPA